MGAIQSSINQAVGAVAGAAVAAKHLKEQELANAISSQRESIIAGEEAVKAESEAKVAEKDYNEASIMDTDIRLDVAQKDVDSIIKTGKFVDGRVATPKDRLNAFVELDKAKEAKEVELGKKTAMEAAQKRATERRDLANKLSEIAGKKANKYMKH